MHPNVFITMFNVTSTITPLLLHRIQFNLNQTQRPTQIKGNKMETGPRMAQRSSENTTLSGPVYVLWLFSFQPKFNVRLSLVSNFFTNPRYNHPNSKTNKFVIHWYKLMLYVSVCVCVVCEFIHAICNM